MSISIYDNGAYVRVVNNATNVVVNYIKSTLVIQKDNNNAFFLKNDSYINYYKYVDVTTPTSDDLDHLISIITGWNITLAAATTTFNPSMLDTLSQLKVSSPYNVQLKIQNTYDSNPLCVDEFSWGNAISSYNQNRNSVNMNLIATNGSRLIRQSKLYPTHTYGSTSFAIVNGTLTTNITNSNVTSKIGLFDDSNDIGWGVGGNGIFFNYNNTSNVSLIYRTNYGGSQVDYEVSQSNWNIDTLNGTGISGETINLSTPTNFIFEWNQISNSNNVRAGIFGHGLHYAHVFSNMPLFGNPSLPVRWEIGHDPALGDPTSATMVQGPATVYSDTIYTGTYNSFTSSRESFVSITDSNSPFPLITVRLQSTYGRAKLRPTACEILNTAPGGVGEWSLVLTGDLNNADWQPITNSYAEIDTNSTVATNGRVVASGYFYDAGVTKIDLKNKDIEVVSRINGYQDILCLQVALVNGTVNAIGSLTWCERD